MSWKDRIPRKRVRQLRALQQHLKTTAQATSDRLTRHWRNESRMFSVHIPKTGGTTFMTVLASHFGDRLVKDYELPREEVNRLIGGRTSYCVHGHFWTDKYADVPDADYVTWLRDPIDRLISQYNFWHNYRFPHDPVWRRVHYDKLDFLSFAKLRYISNEQSRYIAGKPIESFAFVGLMEMFNEGMELFRDQFAILDAELMGQNVGVGEIETVTVGRIRDGVLGIQTGERSLLAIKIGHVRDVPPLLQHEAVARDIVDPRLGHLGPAFMPVEILSENGERQPRQLVIDRLVNRCVDNRPVHAQREFQVDDAPQIVGRIGPGGGSRSHRFRRDEILAIDMRDRCRATDVGNKGRKRSFVAVIRPHGRHGHVGISPHRHVIA